MIGRSVDRRTGASPRILARRIGGATLAAGLAVASVLVASPAAAWVGRGHAARAGVTQAHPVGIRLSVTGTDDLTVDFDVTIRSTTPLVPSPTHASMGSYLYTPYVPGTAQLLNPLFPAIDYGDGATLPAFQLPASGSAGEFRGSFSHTYGSAGTYVIRATATRYPTTLAPYDASPTTGSAIFASAFSFRYFLTAGTYTFGVTNPTYGFHVGLANSTTVDVRTGSTGPTEPDVPLEPCVHDPFHGFFTGPGCTPVCYRLPFHPDRFAKLPCLRGCTVDDHGQTVGTCRVATEHPGDPTTAPPAGPGNPSLTTCLAYHSAAECLGIAPGH